MLTQVTFTADPQLKKQALAKAKLNGLPLKTLLVYALKGFVNGTLTFGIMTNEIEPEIEELGFADRNLNAKANRLAKLLK